jgi:hypothetical protein
MLRLVHPPPAAGQGSGSPARRRGARSPALSLTSDETRHLRAALKNTAAAYGGLDVLASVMGVGVETLYKAAQRRPSGTLAIRLARAAGMAVEAILTGTLNPAGRCPSCGSRVGDKPALRVAGGAR